LQLDERQHRAVPTQDKHASIFAIPQPRLDLIDVTNPFDVNVEMEVEMNGSFLTFKDKSLRGLKRQLDSMGMLSRWKEYGYATGN
jgi:hypothetical protein